jgi:hypothetical protein
VTPDEAFAELGIVPGVDADSARRAYLRLIKTRRPESDPAGFQRARQAYEVVRGVAELEGFAAESARRFGERASADAPGIREPDGHAGGAEAMGDAARAVGHGGGAPAPDGRTAVDDAFHGFLRAWEAVPASANQHERLEVAFEATSALPQDPRPYWLVVKTLSGWWPDDRVVEALRAGHRAGFPEFLEALLARFPGKALRWEVEAALASPHPSLKLAGAVVGARWNPAAASALVVETCRSLQSAPDATLPIAELLNVTLALYEAGALAEAAAAHGAVRSLVSERGMELALMQTALAGTWILTQEVSALPAELPPLLRAAFAAGTRAGDLTNAVYEACIHVGNDGDEMQRWAMRLQQTAPNIAAVLRDTMGLTAANAAEVRRSRLKQLAYLLAVPLTLVFVRTCATSDRSLSSYVPTFSSSQSLPSLPPPSASAEKALDRLVVAIPHQQRVASAAWALCQNAHYPPGILRCQEALDLSKHLGDLDCRGVVDRQIAVRRKLTGKTPTTRESDFLTQVNLAVAELCLGEAPAQALDGRP